MSIPTPLRAGERVRVRASGRTGTVEAAFVRPPRSVWQARVQMDGDPPDRTIVYLVDDLLT